MTDLISEVDSGVARILLNRPQQRNALNLPLLKALHGLLDAWETDDSVRVVTLRGAGRGFCSGADLAEWAEAEARGALETYGWTQAAHALMIRLHGFSKPTLALVNGVAAGAGMDLTLCCDFRIAARSAKFKAGYTSMAYAPDAGASWHLPRLIGEEAAKRFLFLDEPWSAEQALAAGLAGEVVEDEALEAAGAALAARLAAGPSFAYAQTKRLIREGAGRDLADQLAAEQAAGLLCGRTEDAAEALRAVSEKRSPQFKGR